MLNQMNNVCCFFPLQKKIKRKTKNPQHSTLTVDKISEWLRI